MGMHQPYDDPNGGNGAQATGIHLIHEHRLSRVESQVNDLRVTVTKIETDMAYNNRLTEQIKGDTAEMVNISKGMRMLGRLLTALVLLASAVGAVEVFKRLIGS